MWAGVCMAWMMNAYGQDTAPSSWVDRITPGGDLRARLEAIDEEGNDARERARLRARLGVYAEVNEQVNAGLALVSGEDDPTSGNQTLGDGFSSKPVRIDLAYMEWQPTAVEGHTAIIGKMKMPFVTVNDLVWDSELNPEGAALNTALELAPVRILANAGVFWVEERSDARETMLYAGQLAATARIRRLAMTAGVSGYQYENIAGYAPVFNELNGFGNTMIEAADGSLTYANDYGLIEYFVRAGVEAALPLEISANLVDNREVDENGQGYMVGVKAGKLTAPGSFELSYSYKEVESDAVLGVFTDSDSFGGGTDGSTHKWGLGYQIAGNLSGAATYYHGENDLENGLRYDRIQLDLTVKF